MLVPVLLLALALVLRLYRIVPSYDLFIDEVTYSQLADNVARGAGVVLYGNPFTLHPPVGFWILGGMVRLLGLGSDEPGLIFSLRVVPAVFGALTVVLAYGIVRVLRLGTPVALAVALVVALDPFQVYFDSRVMLEAEVQLFVALTLFLLAWLTRPDVRHATALTVGAGLAAGLAASSKETFGLVLVLTLLVLVVSGRAVSRRRTLVVLAVSAGVYAACVVWTSVNYGFSTWWTYRTQGLARLLGTTQTTGFNAPNSQVTFQSRLVANLDQYAVTYALLLLGGIATMVLVVRARLWRGPRSHESVAPPSWTLLAAWSFASCSYLAYATLVGSLEEQMYYIALLPCTLTFFVLLSTLPRPDRRWGSLLVAVVTIAMLAYQGSVWVRVHSTDNNLYRTFFAWERTHVPRGSTVSAAERTAQFVLTGVRLGEWTTFPELRKNRVDYVLVQTKLAEQGYGPAEAPFLRQLKSRGRVAFRASSSKSGDLVLYDVRRITGSSAR
ncbi:hypothetical protein BH10ACT10_BH10ACT10_01980 [soil metagenome]